MTPAIALLGVAVLLVGCASQATDPPPPPTSPSSQPVAAAPVVRHVAPGTKGMRSLQRALAAKGYYHYRIDGRNGPRTKAAVARYQQDLGVTATGDVDDKTWSSLGLSQGN